MASGRKSRGRSKSRARVTTAIAPTKVPTAQMPMSASTTAAIVVPSTPWKKSAKTGSARTSASARNANVAIDFATQIALRSDGASTRPSNTRCSRSGTNARPSPSSAVKTIATQSRPFAARSDELAGSEKWKTTKTATTKSSMAGSVSLARNSSRMSLRASARTSAR